jgi:sugar phosphate isomerase/epimerase
MTSPAPAQGLSRRGFLRAAGLAAGAAALGAKPLASAASAAMCTSKVPDAKIGIQLFTCTGASSVAREATLERIAELGYKLVEHAGYGGDAKAFRTMLKNTGLTSLSGHTALPNPYNDRTWRKMVEDAQIVGQRYIVWPSNSASTVEQWKRVADVMNRAGRVAYEMGMGPRVVGFHNHSTEYQVIAGDRKQRRPIDILMAECDTRFTHMQMDIGWVWTASDPVLELHRFPGRYRQFHVKDMVGIPQAKRPQGGPNAPYGGPVVPGAGMVDFRSVFAAAKESRQPIDSFLIENDASIATCFDAAVAGYELLHGMTYPHKCRAS